jgi:hypothetical protein
LEGVQRTATVILGAITPEVAGRAGSEDNNQEVQHWYRGEYSSTFAFLMEFDTAIKGPEELSLSYR